jgi:hypothetical protein
VIEVGIYQALSADPTLSSLFPAGSTNVFRRLMPKGTILPAVVFMKVFGEGVNSFDGANAAQIRRYQFDSYARDPETVSQMSAAIRALFIPSSSIPGGFPYRLPDNTLIQSAVLKMEMDETFFAGEGGLYDYRDLVDIEFGFVES